MFYLRDLTFQDLSFAAVKMESIDSSQILYELRSYLSPAHVNDKKQAKHQKYIQCWMTVLFGLFLCLMCRIHTQCHGLNFFLLYFLRWENRIAALVSKSSEQQIHNIFIQLNFSAFGKRMSRAKKQFVHLTFII